MTPLANLKNELERTYNEAHSLTSPVLKRALTFFFNGVPLPERSNQTAKPEAGSSILLLAIHAMHDKIYFQLFKNVHHMIYF